MCKAIKIGETFMVKRGSIVNTFRREADDPAPRFGCERIRITHLGATGAANFKPYTFGTEPEWFTQRGLEVAT